MKTRSAHGRSATIISVIRVSFFVVLAAVMGAPRAFSGIGIFAADCTTPKTTFNLGETVCSKADDVMGFRLAWVDPSGFIVGKTEITTNPQLETFTLPSTGQSSIAGLYTANNLGTWRVTAVTSRNSVKTAASFTVRDPNNTRTDLEIVNAVVGADPPLAGQTVQFEIKIANLGPDDAINTHFIDNQFSNATFNSLTQTSGPPFSCNGADCTIATFGAGAKATFLLNFSAGAAGGVLENTATVSSDTVDLNAASNSSTAPPLKVTTAGTPPACNLECPNNMVVSANTTNQGSPGAFVNLPSPEAFGTCGPVTLSPASGSFFPIGVSTVTATASGGGLCSFTVTVISTAPPTISCPANITVAALAGHTTAFVPDPYAPASAPGTATATGSNTSVVGSRSDDLPLSDAYPVGTTTITWTATDDAGRSVSCLQRITVTSSEGPTITCPSDKTFTAPAGSCQITVLAEDIGLPSTTGPDVTLTGARSDGLALTAPYPAGDTSITWTASNLVGRVSCIQKIHVHAIDIEPPTLHIPPDVTAYTSSCSATVDDELGVATAEDNCSSSVSINRTGVPANFEFPTGTTNVTYSATDAAGNTSTGVQHVRVLENPAIRPTITPPADVTLNTGPGATVCGVVVPDSALGNATASDNCPGTTVSRVGIPAGNLFPVGATLLTYVATDASGNTSSATQMVRIIDTTPPVVTAPPAVTLFTGAGATSCGVHVENLDATLGVGSATDNCFVGAVTRTGVPSGGNFPVGTTTLTYSVTDVNGNTASATQSVVVIDNTAPTISCPASMTLEPTCPSGAIAVWTAPVGGDNCAGATTVQSAGPASGSLFPIGTTSVAYKTTDAAGNATSCSFTVTVLTVAAAIEQLKTSVNGSSLQPPTMQGLIPKLNAALDALNKKNTNPACQQLANFINSVQIYQDHGDISAAQAQAWITSAAHITNSLGCTNNPCS